MPRTVRSVVELPADVETAWAVLCGPAWPQALAAELSDDSRLVSHEPAPDGGAVVVVSRRLPQGVPAPLQSFLPGDGRVTATDTWGPPVDGARSGTWSVGWPGAPGRAGGTSVLAPAPGGSRWTLEGVVEVRVPLLGSGAEGFLAPLVDKLAVRQGEVLRGLVAPA